MLSQLRKPLLLITIVIIVLWLIRRFVSNKKEAPSSPPLQQLIELSFFVYIGWVICVTLYPIPLALYKTGSNGRVNLLPFVNSIRIFLVSVFSATRRINEHAGENFFGNILLFMPLGFLAPQVTTIRSWAGVGLLAFLFSLFIETAQYTESHWDIYRTVDVDDIILNSLGAFFGYFLFRIWDALLHRP